VRVRACVFRTERECMTHLRVLYTEMAVIHSSWYSVILDCRWNFTLEQAMKAQRGTGSIALLFL
jgi:hypothetical protein